MKTASKRAFTVVVACIMACLMFVTPVFAATGFYSKTTTKLNAISGGKSTIISLSSGSIIGNGCYITDVKLTINVASGTDPYIIWIKSPDGSWHPYTGPTNSTTLTLHDFDGENPSGTWQIYIENLGVSDNGNLIPISTVTITLKVCYSYL